MVGTRRATLLLLLTSSSAFFAGCAGGNELAGNNAGVTTLPGNFSGTGAGNAPDTGASASASAGENGKTGGGASSAEANAMQQTATGSGGTLRLQQAASDGNTLCVEVMGQDANNGTRADIARCTGQDNQDFTLDGNLVRVFGTKCLSVVDGVNANGAEVQIWDCGGQAPAVSWSFDNGHLRWRGTDKCLDVKDGVFASGTRLQVWACNETSANQTFLYHDGQVATGATPMPTGNTPMGTTPTSSPAPASSSSGNNAASTTGVTLDLRVWRQEVWPAYKFNNEQESYTNNGSNVSFAADGTATIVAKPTGGSSWTSARLSGSPMGALPWYLEADIVAPTGKGSWPAFWLTSASSWPQGGEIDVMEQINGNKQTNISNHWGPSSGQPTFNTHETIDGVDGGQRHRYGVWVTAQGLQFYLDGKIVGSWVTYPAESNFSKIASQMVPIVNVAMGGDWPGYAPQSTGQQKMVIYRVSRDTKPPSK